MYDVTARNANNLGSHFFHISKLTRKNTRCYCKTEKKYKVLCPEDFPIVESIKEHIYLDYIVLINIKYSFLLLV